MIDRKKLIKHFEHLLNAAKGNYQDSVDLTVDAGEEILSLLKESESVEPFHKCIGNAHTLIEDSGFNYCPYCGKRIVDTEGR